jgi:glutathione peroxidase
MPFTFKLLFGSLLAAAMSIAQACPAAFSKQSLEPLMGGKHVPLCSHAGKVVLIVNTASQCGFTPQYKGLEELHKRFGPRGLVVIGVPANDFGKQEPGSNQMIAEFCQANFGVSFFMASKIEVPIATHPLFAALGKASAAAGAKPSMPTWNFHKYLVGRSGQVQSFGTRVEPTSAELIAAVEAALKQAL